MNKSLPIWIVTLVLGIGIGAIGGIVGMKQYGYRWTPQDEWSATISLSV